jgi:hypothetical protein
MGLKSVKGKVGKRVRRANFFIDLSEIGMEGETLTFREPTIADKFPDAAANQQFAINFPEIAANSMLQALIMLLAACYVPDKDEEDTVPAFALAELARDKDAVFFFIAEKFGAAFPDTENFAKAQDDAKNASAE